MKMSWQVLAASLLMAVAFAQPSWAQAAESPTLFGGRFGAYLDAEDLMLGGELLTPVQDRLYFNPNVEYVFVDRASFATFNFDFHYDFPFSDDNFWWAGAGLGILYRNPDGPAEADTDLGANFLFGVGFGRNNDVIPYVQAKVIASNNSDFVVGFGLRF